MPQNTWDEFTKSPKIGRTSATFVGAKPWNLATWRRLTDDLSCWGVVLFREWFHGG